MGDVQTIVDSTYRWGMVALLAIACSACLIPGAYQKGFPKTFPLYGVGGGLLLIVAGLALALVFSESLVDALLLRARFGFMVPDTGVHSYGWALVFGYAIVLTNVAILLIGTVMAALGKVPPWISNKE
jgi:hypothetical protein